MELVFCDVAGLEVLPRSDGSLAVVGKGDRDSVAGVVTSREDEVVVHGLVGLLIRVDTDGLWFLRYGWRRVVDIVAVHRLVIHV